MKDELKVWGSLIIGVTFAILSVGLVIPPVLWVIFHWVKWWFR